MDDHAKIVAVAKAVTKKHGLLKCHQCALELMKVFKSHGFSGQFLKVSAARRTIVGAIVLANPRALSQFGVSDPDTNISENGNHYGVQIGDYVFDNIHKEGVHGRTAWIKRFDCDGHHFNLSVQSFKPK